MRDASLLASPRLVLIRGLPGSGKTSLAKNYAAQGYQHFEADQFFTESGQYCFDKEKQGDAHAWCLEQTRNAIEGGSKVCVANVFATLPDVWPYTLLEVDYRIVEANHSARSVHDVPAKHILDMQRRWVPTEQMIEALRISVSPRRSLECSTGEALPDLTFDLEYSRQQVPWDLRRLLYAGGAGANSHVVYQKIATGELGEPLKERIELVKKMHEVLANALGRGIARGTVKTLIDLLRIFFTWGDEADTRLDLDSIEDAYLHWTDALLNRARVGKGFSERSAYGYGSKVGWVVDRVLDRDSRYPILWTTRLRKPKGSSSFKHSEADKQNLGEIESFGRLLMDIIDGLSVDAIWGSLPVLIPLRDGAVLEEWSGRLKPSCIKPSNPKYLRQRKYYAQRASEKRAAWEADRTLRTRYPLVNLRIEAEMFVFISQTGMNLAQTHRLRIDKFSFKASSQGYAVRAFKARRDGEVLFEIYREYRKVFEAYLAWRGGIFPNDTDGLLFPLITDGRRLSDQAPHFNRIKTACKRAGVKYFPPSQLRKTKANFVARLSGYPEMEAAVMQHSPETFLASYEEPNHQRTMVQVSNFWAVHDPALAAVGPGLCAGSAPQLIVNTPPTATRPDCMTPAGCLFCEHQRDIDSQDHIWALATYRYLKSIELAAHPQPKSNKDLPKHPAELVIDRLTDKLVLIKASSHQRREWVGEALLRIEEGRYHPSWAAMINDGNTE